MLTKIPLFLLMATMLTSCQAKANEPYHILFGISLLLALSSAAMLMFVLIGSKKAIKDANRNWPKGFTTTKRD